MALVLTDAHASAKSATDYLQPDLFPRARAPAKQQHERVHDDVGKRRQPAAERAEPELRQTILPSRRRA